MCLFWGVRPPLPAVSTPWCRGFYHCGKAHQPFYANKTLLTTVLAGRVVHDPTLAKLITQHYRRRTPWHHLRERLPRNSTLPLPVVRTVFPKSMQDIVPQNICFYEDEWADDESQARVKTVFQRIRLHDLRARGYVENGPSVAVTTAALRRVQEVAPKLLAQGFRALEMHPVKWRMSPGHTNLHGSPLQSSIRSLGQPKTPMCPAAAVLLQKMQRLDHWTGQPHTSNLTLPITGGRSFVEEPGSADHHITQVMDLTPGTWS